MSRFENNTPLLPPPSQPPAEIALARGRFSRSEGDIHYYWRVIYGRRRLLLASTLLGLSVAAALTFRQPRLYVAQATVEFKQALPPGKDLDIRNIGEAISPTLATRLLTTKVLAAHVINAERAKGEAWFDPSPDNPAPPSILRAAWNGLTSAVAAVVTRVRLAFGTASPDTHPETQAQGWDGVDLATINRYYGHIAVQPVRGTSLADVVVTHTAPAIAAKVANDHTQAFIEMDVETKIASLQDAQSLLGRQLNQVKAQYETSRKALTDYQLAHGILSLPENNSTLSRESLKQLNTLLIETQGQRIVAEASYRNAAAMTPDRLANTLPDDGLQALRTELLALVARYQGSLQDYGSNHPEMVALRARLDALRGRLRAAALQARDRLEATFTAYRAKETDLRTNLETLARASSEEDRQLVQLSILQGDQESNKQLYNTLLQQAKEADLASGAFRWTNAKLIDRAVVPTTPSFPKTRRNLGLGLFLGLAAGAFGCLLLERLDNRIHTPDEVAAILDLPAFGVIPDFRSLPASGAYGYAAAPREDGKEADGSEIASTTVLHPQSLVSEAYRTLRTNLMFSSPGQPPHSVLVTSSEAGEGKSITVINLAVSLALSGARVAVVDADMRRPSCHRALKVHRHPGLADVLTGQCDLGAALTRSPIFAHDGYRLPNDEGLYILPAGTAAPNPAELLGSAVMDNVLQQLKEQFEFVLIDSPPVLRITDSVVLATKAEGVLFVVKGGEWGHDVIQRAVAQLDSVRANTLGIVLNCVDVKRGGSSYYYYRHYHRGYYGASADGATANADEGSEE